MLVTVLQKVGRATVPAGIGASGITENYRSLCISMALANMVPFFLGGMPLRHGAGGLANDTQALATFRHRLLKPSYEFSITIWRIMVVGIIESKVHFHFLRKS